MYSKDLRLKLVDAVDRGMACQGVAHNREALGEAIPDALSSVKLKYVVGNVAEGDEDDRDGERHVEQERRSPGDVVY